MIYFCCCAFLKRRLFNFNNLTDYFNENSNQNLLSKKKTPLVHTIKIISIKYLNQDFFYKKITLVVELFNDSTNYFNEYLI